MAATEVESDEDYARRARAGDRAAFQELVVRHQSRILRLAARLCANASDAEEVTQETFLQAFRGIGSWKGDARFGTWLHHIAVNAALMRRRADRRRPVEPLAGALPDLDARELELTAGDPWPRADVVLERKRIAHSIRDALARLALTYRAAFVLHLQGLGVKEAARVLGISRGAVRQRVHRARLMLREQLRPLLAAG
jgi:RNA polymerase sigma-70 factor, ECF subfamily